METCKVCHHPVEASEPFCISCGHARIVESLQVPMKRPPWFDTALKAGAAALAIWFVITVGIAFLREAKSLRRARAALEANDATGAYGWVAPFVASHPDHLEALFLAGSSAIKCDKPVEAVNYYSRLVNKEGNEDAIERVKKLETIYHEEIRRGAAQLECGQSAYAAFYETYEPLGQKFFDTLIQSAAVVARKCVLSNQRGIANEPGYWLINAKNFDAELVVTALYIEPLKAALDNRQYHLARVLAWQGISQWPQAEPKIDDLLGEIRGQVTETVGRIEALCSTVSRDPEFHQGRSACFPAVPPSLVTEQSDAWGNPLIYTASILNEATQCHREFKILSLGADALLTTDDSDSPAMEITCELDRWNRLRFRRPDRFWSLPS